MLFEPCLRADFKDFVIFLSFLLGFLNVKSQFLSLWLVEKTKSSRAKPAISQKKYIFDKKTCKKVLSVSKILKEKLVKSQRLIYHGYTKGVVILGRRQSRFGKRFNYYYVNKHFFLSTTTFSRFFLSNLLLPYVLKISNLRMKISSNCNAGKTQIWLFFLFGL